MNDWRISPFLPLFVPANRPERFEKAARSGSDAIIVDLEDSVAEDEKSRARELLLTALRGKAFEIPVLVRINSAETDHFDHDIEIVESLDISAVMLPKAEAGNDVDALRQRLGPNIGLIGLVETPKGIAAARALARQCDRLAFGSIDFANYIKADHAREALLTSRSELVLASALAGIAQPLDGVTVDVEAAEKIEDDARYAAALGFGGKLLIHPDQVTAANKGFMPAPGQIEWARRLLAATGGNAGRFEGRMVDKPVLVQARNIINVFERSEQRNRDLASG